MTDDEKTLEEIVGPEIAARVRHSIAHPEEGVERRPRSPRHRNPPVWEPVGPGEQNPY